ncbi:hypothetical protein [Azotobacter chroococcum]|uniref:Uncharacterized protein n=1 Tax=Azotobacter chroococcum TaxID=353 RepID=A0AAP9YGV2_9GAMM|nr:hypothetical protein [Azotobacter chroococcum]QQE90443.1 hypothetical protein GKQ51_09300 [Azotobacter chroococcum]
MERIDQIRAEIEDARQAAWAAPGQEAAEPDWERVSRLEAELRELEDTPEKVKAERDLLRTQLQQAGWKLSAAERDVERLSGRVTWLESIIANQIGRPVDGLSPTKLAFRLEEVREQRQRLADGISKASTLADLQHMKNVARNMGLIDRRNQYERLAACLGQG